MCSIEEMAHSFQLTVIKMLLIWLCPSKFKPDNMLVLFASSIAFDIHQCLSPHMCNAAVKWSTLSRVYKAMSLSLSLSLSNNPTSWLFLKPTPTNFKDYLRGKLYEEVNIENMKMITVVEMMKVGNTSEKAATILQFCIWDTGGMKE